MLNGWADTTCLSSLNTYLAPTPLFSGVLLSPNPGCLIRTLGYHPKYILCECFTHACICMQCHMIRGVPDGFMRSCSHCCHSNSSSSNSMGVGGSSTSGGTKEAAGDGRTNHGTGKTLTSNTPKTSYRTCGNSLFESHNLDSLQ